MLGGVLRIHWHDRQPVFSADFDPNDGGRVATAGGDNNIWRLKTDNKEDGVRNKAPVYCATLSRHLKSVNCVRFSHSGDFLASAGDGGSLIVWRQASHPIGQSRRIFGSASDEDEVSDDGSLEYWVVVHTFRASDVEDIYDICWSPDDDYILVGLTDNTSQVWDVNGGKCIRVLRDHHHFVQGVAWDPLGTLLITQSADRSAKVWQARRKAASGALQFAAVGKFSRTAEAIGEEGESGGSRSMPMFQDETLVSFFRRAAFSPDGALVFLPAGVHYGPDGTVENCCYIVGRGQVSMGSPTARITGFTKAVLGIRCNPRLFQNIKDSEEALFRLPYRIVYAVFTMDTLMIFDSRQSHPIAAFGDLHYGSLTDIAWAPDGYSLLLTSTDGFCSLVEFKASDLGHVLDAGEQASIIEELRIRYGLVKRQMSILPSQAVVAELAIDEGPAEVSLLLPLSDPVEEEMVNSTMPSTEAQLPYVEIENLPATLIRRRIQPTLIE